MRILYYTNRSLQICIRFDFLLDAIYSFSLLYLCFIHFIFYFQIFYMTVIIDIKKKNIQRWWKVNGMHNDIPMGTARVPRLKTAAPTSEPKARARRPQRSRKKTRTKSAGNSVTEAMLNVRKTLRPRLAVFLAWPSYTTATSTLSSRPKNSYFLDKWFFKNLICPKRYW